MGWFLGEPGFSIGHMTAVFNSGAMSPLNNGDIAPLLKTAVICPILKPGSPRNHPKPYRPVSLTSHIIKVFERIIRTAIVKHLEDNDSLPRINMLTLGVDQHSLNY